MKTSDPHGWIVTETVQSRYGAFEFKGGYPTEEAANKLYELRTFCRAVEAYLAMIPAMSFFFLGKGLKAAGIDAPNKFLIAETLFDAKSLFLTANTETVYGMTFLDLKRDGPVVVEAPAGFLGGFSAMWQTHVIGMGPTDVDKGKGGKFLILPPDYTGEPPAGYFIAKSPTYGGWMAVRGFQVDGKPDKAVADMKHVKIYRLADAGNPPAMVFMNGSGMALDTIAPDDIRYFEGLAAFAEEEPLEVVPPEFRFLLASVGIEKGKPFKPDDNAKKLLDEAARVASAIARTNSYVQRDPTARIYPDRRWEWAFVGGSATFDAKGYLDIDQRAAWTYTATGASPAMVQRKVGSGSQYLVTTHDASGAFLDGARSYRLNLPANIPAQLFWSVVVYDAVSRSELQTDQKFPSVSTYTNPVANADGSIDIAFGPEAPAGNAKNWIKTVPGRGWFPYIRLYSPAEAFFDQSWRPGDINEVR